MSGALDGKIAVVTGGGTGIGEATARLFASEGCQVVVAGLATTPIERVAEEIGGLAIATDVTRDDQMAALFQDCDEAFGRLDVLVNNAGVTGPTMAVEETDMAAWDATFAVNTRAIIVGIKHALPLLKRQGGAILNVSSRMARVGKPLRAAYTASKFAVLGITESVAHEVGVHGIRVNTILPGGTDTRLLRDVIISRARMQGRTEDEVARTDYAAQSALGKLLEPSEIASVALFLASETGSAITGTHLMVDGGRL
jgi:NAD(P)-dependent dehydrogenase (short-subunit alcohol dehydrogenase family)